MRPLRLKLQAFGPYPRESVVDFRFLGEGGLFLIHGPTGAGKTSILDGICFALFGRASGAERAPDALRSDRAPSDLATRAGLEFALGSDVYRVTRQPKQELAKKRGEGTTTSRPEGVLEKRPKGDDGLDSQSWELVASGDKKTDDAIVALLGMNEEQFRQVVVLPQGQFRKFLAAGSDDREALLERLFRTHRFRELCETMDERSRVLAKEISEKRHKAAALLSSFDVTSDVDFDRLAETARTRLAELESAEAEMDSKHKTASARLNSAREVAKLRTDLAAAESARLRFEAEAKTAREQRENLEKRKPEAKAWELEIEQIKFLLPKAERLSKERSESEKYASDLARVEKAGNEISTKFETLKSRRPVLDQLADSLQEKIVRAGEIGDAYSSLNAEIVVARELYKKIADFQKLISRKEETASLLDSAEKEWGNTHRTTAELKLAYHVSQAARLAAELDPGDACPVCGSADHPKKAELPSETPTVEQIDAAEALLAKKHEAKLRTLTQLESLTEEVSKMQSELSLVLGGAPDEWEAQVRSTGATLKAKLDELEAIRGAGKSAQTELEKLKLERERIERERIDLERQQRETALALEHLRTQAAQARTRVEELENTVPVERRDVLKLESAGRLLGQKLDEFRANESAVQLKAERANAEGAAAAERVKTLHEQIVERQKTRAHDVDLPRLEREFTEIDKLRTDAKAERLSLAQRLVQLANVKERSRGAAVEIAELEDRYKVVGRLAEISAGRPPNELRINFQRYVLASRLDDVLEQASRRLHAMSSGRFTLKRARKADDKRKSAGLDLEVEDAFTGTARATASLSGGEGFLASLALALGLADVVQMHLGGVRLEAVFVDEGFGTLDPEALELAMRTLADLQAGGRMVGIISHVPELRDQIARRLAVRKTVDGSDVAWETGTV